MQEAFTRRYTVPPITGQPLAVAYASPTDPLRVLVRNEGTGGNEDDSANLAPAPLWPFNMPIGPPLTFPFATEQPCLLATEFNDLSYASQGSCYVLTDGGADVLILAPGQTLFALSGTGNKSVISVEIIHGMIVGDVYFSNTAT